MMAGKSSQIFALTVNNQYYGANFIFLLALFCLAFFVIYLFRKQGNIKLFIYLLIYHTGMSTFYYFFQPWPPYDTAAYYLGALEAGSIYEFFRVGGGLVGLTLYPFVKYMHISFFSGFMLFNVIGFIGLLFFYITMKSLVYQHEKANKLLNIIIFLPGISYWTGIISKESIVFLGITMVLYALLNFNVRIIYFLLGSLFIVWIRPHIFVGVMLAILLAMVFLAKTNVIQKFIFISLLLILMVPTYHLLLERTNLETIDLEIAQDYVEERGVNWGGGSGIDIQNYNLLFKLFTYLYRPLFIDVRSIPMAIASFENLFYLIITLQMCSLKFIRFIRNEKSLFISFNLLYFICGAVMLSNTEGNLGTAMRHKIMLMPSLLALSLLYRAKIKPMPVKQDNLAVSVIKDPLEKVV